jgi:hypothetical protein
MEYNSLKMFLFYHGDSLSGVGRDLEHYIETDCDYTAAAWLLSDVVVCCS